MSEIPHLLVHEQVEGGIQAAHPMHGRVLDVPLQPQVVGRARRHRDGGALAVHLFRRLELGAGGHQVGRLDLHIGGGEVDIGRPLRLRADKADIPKVILG